MKLIILILSIFAIFAVTSGQLTQVQTPMVKESMSPDGSCLFSSIQYVLTTGELEDGVNEAMRERITKEIDENPLLYNAAILDDSIETYKRNILKPTTWGSGIELEVFSNFYEMEIGVCNETKGNIMMIGAEKDHRVRVYIVFNSSRVHYDAVYRKNYPTKGEIQTIFRTDDDNSYAAAVDLCDRLHANLQSVNYNYYYNI